MSQIPVLLYRCHQGCVGRTQRAGQLGEAYSLGTHNGSTVGVPGALGPARPEVIENRGGGG